MDILPSPVIIAHRGFRHLYPENTLASFHAALQSGAHMIELDVTLSRDRNPVVIHDDTLDRTSDGTGPVRNIDLTEIKKLDAGSWFDPRFKGEQIPTLKEVLDHFGGRIPINIEIKASAFEPDNPSDSIERQVIDLVRSRKCSGSVLISSFHPEILNRIKQLDNNMAIGLLTEEQDADTICRLADTLHPYSWNPDADSVSPAMVDRMHKRNIRVFPYTVNSVSQAQALLQMKVDGLFTDDPATMIQKSFELKR